MDENKYFWAKNHFEKKLFIFFEKNRKNIFLENYFHTFKKSKWGIFLADLVDNHVF